jgi:glycerol-3-phosphate dehydrogenase
MIGRARAIELLASEQFDVIVIGGELTGAGVALDAGAAGLVVGLVERDDFSAARVDEARLCLSVLTAAERRGAIIANRVEVTDVVECDGRVVEVRARDVERGGCFAIAADRVVDAVSDRVLPAYARVDEGGVGAHIEPDRLQRLPGMPEPTYAHLATRYGEAAVEVLATAAADPAMAAPIVAGHPDLLAEVLYAARHEQARSVADVLLRRTDLGLTAAAELADRDAPLLVARAMAAELGWTEHRVAAEVAEWARASRARPAAASCRAGSVATGSRG